MIKISKQNNSLIVEGIDNVFYPNNGDNSYPLNSLIVVTDNSDMATFRSVATNDVLFSGLIKDITINGEAVTKDNIIEKFDAVSNGGTVDAYTKEEADTKFATKTELTNVQTVANDADTKVDALTPRVESVETAMGNKQDILVSGTNIKTINNESVLGEGNIEVRGGIKTYEASEIPSVLLQNLKSAVFNSQDKKSYINSTETDLTPIQHFLDNLSNGDYLKLYNDNATKVQFVGNGERSTGYQFNIIVNGFSGSTTTIIYSNYITVILFPSSSQMRVSNNSSVPVARVTDISILQNDKQDLLVSGTNIKTINNQSILGEGNIEISGEVDLTNYYTKPEADGKFATITGFNEQAADISALQTAMDGKQATLVSGENIKTINSQSILGSGDLTISGVSEEQAQEIAKIPTLETELAQKANVSDVPTVQTGSAGTNKNYVYSNADSSNTNDKVVSYCDFAQVSSSRLTLNLTYWGDKEIKKNIPIPLATFYAAGLMSGDDKNKLNSIPENIAANVSALETSLGNKQDILVSGTNIKTINNQSILGEGNLEITGGDVDLTNYYTKTETDTKLDAKQNTLVSGTNIKTINSQSILGEGNIEVSGVSEEQAQEIAKIPNLETELAQKANVSDVPTVQTGKVGTNKNYIYSDPNTSSTNVISNVTLVRKLDSIRMQKYYWLPDDSTSTNYVTDILPSATTTEAGVMSAADKTKLDSISNEWTGTQSEYDALTTKDNNTIYYVTE